MAAITLLRSHSGDVTLVFPLFGAGLLAGVHGSGAARDFIIEVFSIASSAHGQIVGMTRCFQFSPCSPRSDVLLCVCPYDQTELISVPKTLLT